MATGRGRKAVLVLPDVGLDEKQLERVKGDFQNNLVSTLRTAGARDEVVVVVIVVVEQ
jgi:hypothetical protein